MAGPLGTRRVSGPDPTTVVGIGPDRWGPELDGPDGSNRLVPAAAPASATTVC